MGINLLDAICNVIESDISEVAHNTHSSNRMNRQGESLEAFVKDAFVGTLLENDDEIKMKAYRQAFSYLGNQNNPPDFMVRGGDAVEVKKVQGKGNRLMLNSSYPKAVLNADSPMIAAACRDAEKWTEKDLLYVVGRVVGSTELQRVWFVYGDCYAAEAGVYERAKDAIKTSIKQSGLELEPTNELAKIKRVDPLGLTDMRVRNMWDIAGPEQVFSKYLAPNPREVPRISAVMSEQKYLSMPQMSVERVNVLGARGLTVNRVELPDPNNAASVKVGIILDWLKS